MPEGIGGACAATSAIEHVSHPSLSNELRSGVDLVRQSLATKGLIKSRDFQHVRSGASVHDTRPGPCRAKMAGLTILRPKNRE